MKNRFVIFLAGRAPEMRNEPKMSLTATQRHGGEEYEAGTVIFLMIDLLFRVRSGCLNLRVFPSALLDRSMRARCSMGGLALFLTNPKNKKAAPHVVLRPPRRGSFKFYFLEGEACRKTENGGIFDRAIAFWITNVLNKWTSKPPSIDLERMPGFKHIGCG